MNALTSSRDTRLPLYQRLRDEILDKITRGEWRPDEAIPTEQELTQLYGIATGTVRKAVEVLVSEGLLVRIQGKGTFVRRPSFDSSLFRFFRHLMVNGERRIPEARILARNLAQPPAAVTEKLKIGPKAQAIRLDRLRRIEDSVVLVEEIWLPQKPFAKLLKIGLDEFGNLLYPFYAEVCGQSIASARETLTVESADREAAKRLGIAEGKPIVVIERLALGYDQEPLEWRRSYGSAETFRYQIDIC